MCSNDLPVGESLFYRKLRANVQEWIRGKGASNKWAEYIVLVPDVFHLLVKLSLDKDVPTVQKVKLVAAIAYFLSPIDLVPDFIPVIGYLDDLVLAAYALNSIINDVDPEVVKRNWAGDGEILDNIQRILAVADQMLGSGLVRKLFGLIKGK